MKTFKIYYNGKEVDRVDATSKVKAYEKALQIFWVQVFEVKESEEL